MSLATVQVFIDAQQAMGQGLANGIVKMMLTRDDVEPNAGAVPGALMVPTLLEADLDADGLATVARWPNARGTQGSQYQVWFFDSAGKRVGVKRLAYIPDADCNLHDVLNLSGPAELTDAQRALNGAQAAQIAARAVLTDPAFVAVSADLTNIDAVAADLTNIDVVGQNIADVVAAADNMAAIVAAPGYAAGAQAADLDAQQQAQLATTLTATAQAAAQLAGTYAASASSVVQQDLSAVVGAALHRSPNAIVATVVYDVSRDSDGGAWVDRVGETSWMLEALNGSWLGACATEAAARAVTGAATGSYFQLTTDGKFYKLNAGAGTTEVFRGNTAKFPRLAAIVAEPTKVVIYDLTQPGRPMWKVLLPATNGGTAGITGVSSGAGCVAISGNAGVVAFQLWNFPADRITHKTGQSPASVAYTPLKNGYVYGTSVPADGSSGIASSSGNAVAMTVMPDAPLDPFTGLQVPTIVVGTTAGLSVIQNSGVVVNSSSSTSFTAASMNKDTLVASAASANLFYALKPGALGASFAVTSLAFNAAPYFNPTGQAGGVSNQYAVTRSLIAGRAGSAVALMQFNETTPAASLVAYIAATYNTGWMVGDLRRCWLSDNAAGSIAPTELVTNGTFNTDISGWTPNSAGAAVWDASAQMKVVTLGAGSWNYATQTIATVIGKTYRMSGALTAGTATNYRLLAGTVAQGGTYFSSVATPGAVTGPAFVATTTTTVITCQVSDGVVGSTVFFDDISLQEVIADRSYKNKPLTIFGTLVKTLTGGLAMYSGWSATNYAQEAYSADLDFGTGAWSVSAWANVPAVLPAASFPVSATDTIAVAADRDFSADTGFWTKSAATIASGVCTMGSAANITRAGLLTIGKSYLLTYDLTVRSGGAYLTGFFAQTNATTSGTKTFRFTATSGTLQLSTNAASDVDIDNVSVKELGISCAFDRSAAAGPYIKLGATYDGKLACEVYDTVTTRRVTSPAAYNTATNVKVRAEYATSGTLTLKINGQPVASTTGTPLLTLNNASAVTTIGNSRTLDAAFPGSIALVKAGATTPTQEQSTFMYEQEKFLWMPGAVCTLPDSGAVLDMDYDPMMDRLKVVSAANESSWSGLVSTMSVPVSAGAFTKCSHRSGIKLLARSTTNPGVDVSIPAYGLREEMFNRAERAAALARLQQPFDFDAITGQTDFTLQVGYTAIEVISGRSSQREGSTKDFTRLFDGFRETIRFNVAPGNAAWVQILARRAP
jgi:hypothetical protein